MLEKQKRIVEVYNETTLNNEDNSKREVVQKKVKLHEDDPFEDEDEVVVLSVKDYEKLVKNTNEDCEEKDKEIAKLNEQIETLKNSFFDDVYQLKDQLSDKEKLIEANNKIAEIDAERVAILKELDYKNKMILAYNVELNKSILKAINVVIDEARDNINNKNQQIAEKVEESIEQSKKEINEKNKAIAFEINSTIDAINEEIRNTSTLKLILNKKNINLSVPTEDLLKPFEFDVDINYLLDKQTLELDASEILKEVMPKLPEPFSKYIDTLEEEDDSNTIDIEVKDDENGT